MEEPNFYLHIGPPKTATTFLQDEVLARIHSADCIVKPQIRLGGESVEFGDLFLFSPEVWSEVGGDIFESLTSESTSQSKKRKLIVSDERVYGGVASPQPWIPSWISESVVQYGDTVRFQRQTSGKPDPSFLFFHLRELSKVAVEQGFSGLKVLLTLRRQDTKLTSSYTQLSNRVRGASQEGFENWIRDLVKQQVGYHMGGGVKLNYFLWWKRMAEAIGKENVFLIPFELLEERSSEFLGQWLEFLNIQEKERIIRSLTQSGGCKKNTRSKSRSQWAIRKPMKVGPEFGITRILRMLGVQTNLSFQWFDFCRDNEICLTPEVKEEILSSYRDSNRLLDETLSYVNLERYGYY